MVLRLKILINLQLKEIKFFQNTEFPHFFLFLWVIIALLDPYPTDQADPCGSGSTTLIQIYSELRLSRGIGIVNI
jgi:hypothetical protein